MVQFQFILWNFLYLKAHQGIHSCDAKAVVSKNDTEKKSFYFTLKYDDICFLYDFCFVFDFYSFKNLKKESEKWLTKAKNNKKLNSRLELNQVCHFHVNIQTCFTCGSRSMKNCLALKNCLKKEKLRETENLKFN